MLAWCLSACPDAEIFTGTYHELVPPVDPATGKYERDFVLGLDLFQFGEERGGIVRYYSLREVEGTEADPFERPDRVCFWTNVVEAEEGSAQLRLAYTDDRERVNDLVLQSDSSGGLQVQRVVFADTPGVSFEQQAHTLEVLEDVEADNTCAHAAEEFRLTIQLDAASGLQRLGAAELAGELCAGNTCADTGQTCDPLTGACMAPVECATPCAASAACSPRTGRCEAKAPPGRLTLALAWVGQGRSEVYAWGTRVATLPQGVGQTSFDLLRNLPPGQWQALPIPWVESGNARVVMGVVLAYRDDDAPSLDEEDLTPGAEVSPDWDKRGEPLVGSAFEALSETERRGLVLLYIDGDPEELDPDFLRLFTDRDERPLEPGYGVYELIFDIEDPQRFTLRRAAVNAIKLRLREWSLALDAEDIDKNLPRIPNL